MLAHVGTALMLVAVLASFIALVWGWGEWRGRVRELPLPRWKMWSAVIGLISVTAQAVIFIAFWTPLFRQDALVARWTLLQFLLFIAAVPCVIGGKPLARLWLIPASFVLLVGSFFVSLAP